MTRYYLGVPVYVSVQEYMATEDGWVWAVWPDGRRFKHWADQLRKEPWG